MPRDRTGVSSGAAHRLRAGWILLLLVGNAVLGLGAWAWLHIPDSHVWQFVLSVLSALLLLVIFLWMYTKSIVVARESGIRSPRWASCTWLLAGILIAHIWMRVVGGLADNIEKRAGYWNSQLSVHMRTVFTYPRLVEYQDIVITMLSWLLPLLLLPLVIELVTRNWNRGVIRESARVLLRWQYWLVAIVTLIAGFKLTSTLVDWHPAYTVRGELISVALRLALAYGLDILLGCVVLAVTCELLSQASLGEGFPRNPTP